MPTLKSYSTFDNIRTISPGEVSALNHEVLDDPVELGPLVSEAFLPRGQRDKVLRGLGHRATEDADLNAADGLTTDRNVEVHLK